MLYLDLTTEKHQKKLSPAELKKKSNVTFWKEYSKDGICYLMSCIVTMIDQQAALKRQLFLNKQTCKIST